MMVWKMIVLFNWVIFRFHVNLLGGCNSGMLQVIVAICGLDLSSRLLLKGPDKPAPRQRGKGWCDCPTLL